MEIDNIHEAYRQLVLDKKEQEDKYTELYNAHHAYITKYYALKDKHIRVKNENLRHMQDKVYLQDEILKRDVARHDKPTRDIIFEL